jgi:ABC transporter substrate binding protein (PQQ-dependent alcohol dehydrogenase system)
LFAAAALVGYQTGPAVCDETKLAAPIVYLSRAYAEPLPLSLVEPIITDKGLQGARLGLSDNVATGRILKHDYTLVERVSSDKAGVVAAARDLLGNGHRLIVADLEPDELLAVADLAEAQDAIILNARSSNDALRGASCRHNVFHVAPSFAMRADALAQYLAWKQWRNWFLVYGDTPMDAEYVAAIKRAAARFGAKIVEERKYTFDPGNRRAETGHQQIQTQMPLLTQGARDHDVVFVSDLDEAFGEYLLWRTSLPKPVVGTQGLMAVAWHRSYEQYGGSQLQGRFEKFAKRLMTERDYLAWLATRVFGEAITRANTVDAAGLRAFLLSKAFTVAGFKGQGLSFRKWDRQLRQPLLLTGPRSLVSMSPQDGFLHEKFLTDTLGYDEPETHCRLPN